MKPQINSNGKFAGVIMAIALLAMIGTSCDVFNGDEAAVPEIDHVRYVHPDSAAVNELESLQPGEMFVIEGRNLDHVKEAYFNGIQASFNPVYVTSSNMIISVPEINFLALDPDSEELNTIRLVSDAGTTTFEFPIVPPPAGIHWISREFAPAGEVIHLYGESLFLITDVLFPGNVSASNFTVSPNADRIDVEVPSGVTEGGPIVVVTANGEVPSPISSHFNDVTGMISNFDDIDHYDWGAIVSDADTTFTQNTGFYAFMNTSSILPNNWAWWEDTRSVNIAPIQWMDASNLDDPIHNWALRFEINIAEPIEYGTFLIRTNDDWDFIARYEPWTETGEAYATDGWLTVSIPLNHFRSDNGNGQEASSIRDLHFPDESMGIMFVNDDEEEEEVVERLLVAFDNIRVVRIEE